MASLTRFKNTQERQISSKDKFRFPTITAIVIANMVGTGVFTSLGFQLLDIQSGFVILVLWSLGGLIAVSGAMTYAELGAAFPRSGGESNFLSEIYHPAVGFGGGWTSLTLGFAGPTALAAMTFAAYATSILEVAPSAWLERANHHSFNQLLTDDPFRGAGRPDCEPILEPGVQRAFLVDYAADFLVTLFDEDATAVSEAMARLGLDVEAPAPDELYGLPGQVATLADAADRRPLLVPTTARELTTNLVGGAVTEQGITTHFCPEGHYTPAMMPGSEPCHRITVTIPGQPALAVVSWAEPGAAWRFALPAGEGDLSGYMTLSLRAAVDPLSPLNAAASSQAFTLQLADRAGNRTAVPTRPDEPALAFPAGLAEEDEFTGDFFTGPVPMTTIRWTLSSFDGVDLTDIGEIALLFDQTASGSLFLGDLEWARPSQP